MGNEVDRPLRLSYYPNERIICLYDWYLSSPLEERMVFHVLPDYPYDNICFYESPKKGNDVYRLGD